MEQNKLNLEKKKNRWLQKGKTIVNFLHIGKTGGTAIKHALANAKSEKYGIILHGHFVNLNDIPSGEKIIFILRNPVDRFISSFYSRLRKGQPRYYSEWTKMEEGAFNNFSTPNELGEALSSDNILIKEKAIKAMKGIRHVKHNIYHWIVSDEIFEKRIEDILFVGFQETLKDDFEKLKKILDLPIDLTLPNDEVNSHRNPSNLDKNLSETALQNLNNWYEDDLRFYKRMQAYFK